MKISFGSICFLLIGLAVVNGSDAWVIFRNRFWNKLFGRRRDNAAARAPTTSPKTPSTTPTTPPTSLPHSCEPTYNYDPNSNWCYGTYCDEKGRLIAWDNFNCKSTSTTPPSTPPSSPSRPPGCEFNGRFYPPNTEIERGQDRKQNFCWVVLCDSSGSILFGDDFNCFPTSSTSSTTPPSTSEGVRNIARAFRKVVRK